MSEDEKPDTQYPRAGQHSYDPRALWGEEEWAKRHPGPKHIIPPDIFAKAPSFELHELEMIRRALRRLSESMRESGYIGDDDPHFAKCEALRTKVSELVQSSSAKGEK